MLNENLLESSEFYNKRYGNFATKLLYPLLIFIICIIILLCNTTKEITIKSIGNIEPQKSSAVIQSTSNNKILKTNMKENKLVHKNENLIKFDKTNIKSENNLVDLRMNNTTSKLTALNELKESVLKNKNLMSSDIYGFSSRYKEYVYQISELNLNYQQNNYDRKNNELDLNKKNTDISISNNLLNAKQESLKYKMIESINEEIDQVNDNLLELNNKSINIKSENNNQTVKSPITGVLHLKENISNKTYLPLGTEIADIYPKLTRNTPLIVNFYVPTSRLNNLKIGQKIKFNASQQGPNPLIVKGKIKQIDGAATETKNGNFYKVIANISPNPNDMHKIKYGLTGNVSIITGKKTWFNYIKDLILK